MDHAAFDHTSIDSSQAEFLSDWRIDELHCVDAEASNELVTTGVRQWTDFEHGGADGELCSTRQVFLAEIHVDVELIAGEWPTFFLLRNQCGDARVHDVDLHFRMRRMVGSF